MVNDGGSGGGDFRGIDPDKLGDLIRLINKHTGDGAESVDPYVRGWLGHARRIGMTTGRLMRMDKHLRWANGELGMLRRRHSLAKDAGKQNTERGIGGMVSAGAGPLGKYKTQAAAEAAARKDAKAFKDGDLDLKEFMNRLADNQADPDYCAAAMRTLGDTALLRLQGGPAVYDPKNTDAGMSVLAASVATAMRNGVSFKDPHGNEDIRQLVPYLEHADFPSDVLANLAKQCLAPGNYMYGDRVWKAVAEDPAAATTFLHQNMDRIPQWMKEDSGHRGGLPDGQAKAFADVIKAGTMGGPGADQETAANNAEKLIKYYGEHSDEHTHTEVQAAFGQIVTHYWEDVQASLTDPYPADQGPGHLTVDEDDMRGFIREAMYNPKVTSYLLAFSKDRANEIAVNNPDNPVAEHASGLIGGIFSYEALEVYRDLKEKGEKEAEKWNSSVQGYLETGMTTAVEIAFDPGGKAVTLSKMAINEAFKAFTRDTEWVGEGKEPEPPPTVTWHDEWQKAARVVYAENPSVGNPDQYAKQYSDGKPFLQTDGPYAGAIVDDPTAEQRRAYSAWLKDQDLAKAADPHFQRYDNGRLDGYTPTGG